MITARLVSTPAPCEEVEITRAAVLAFGRLLRALGTQLQAHATPEGGLICEDRTVRTRPTMWRIAPDGTLLPDSPYSFVTRAFTTAASPLAEPALAA